MYAMAPAAVADRWYGAFDALFRSNLWECQAELNNMTGNNATDPIHLTYSQATSGQSSKFL